MIERCPALEILPLSKMFRSPAAVPTLNHHCWALLEPAFHENVWLLPASVEPADGLVVDWAAALCATIEQNTNSNARLNACVFTRAI